jgi:hypothetical protein
MLAGTTAVGPKLPIRDVCDSHRDQVSTGYQLQGSIWVANDPLQRSGWRPLVGAVFRF